MKPEIAVGYLALLSAADIGDIAVKTRSVVKFKKDDVLTEKAHNRIRREIIRDERIQKNRKRLLKNEQEAQRSKPQETL